MMDMFDLASKLFGTSRAESSGGVSNGVDTIIATGATDSDSGAAGIVFDADVTPPDDYDGDETIIEIPTSPTVAAGDDVMVSLSGDGPLKVPMVIANPGSGDRMQTAIDSAASLASAAQAVAEATGQHFWDDANGAHVTQVTRDEWEDSSDPNYHSGPNSLWNSLGMLFRDGLTNLLAILTNGIAIYDGNGNNASNILAEFAADHVRVGGAVPENDVVGASVLFFDADDEQGSAITATAYSSGDGVSDQDVETYVSVRSAASDNGRSIDTGSKVESSLSLDQKLWYGISDPNEQHNEAIASLVSDATYDAGGADETTCHARVGATATTTGTSGTGYVEAVSDKIGIGTNESNITYFDTSHVISTFNQAWVNLGSAGSSQTTFTLPRTGTYLMITGHNSTAASNGIFILRTGGNNAFKMAGGGNITATLSGVTLKVTSSGGTVNVFVQFIG